MSVSTCPPPTWIPGAIWKRTPLSPNGLLYLTICPTLPNSLCCSSMVAALNRNSLVLLFVLSIRMSQVWQSWQYSDSKYRREQNLLIQSATEYLLKYINWAALYWHNAGAIPVQKKSRERWAAVSPETRWWGMRQLTGQPTTHSHPPNPIQTHPT